MAACSESPYRFTLHDLDQLDLSLENRQLLESLLSPHLSDDKKTAVLEGKDIGKLLYLYMMGHKTSFLEEYQPRNAEPTLKKFFQDANQEARLQRLQQDFLPPQKRDQN
ncbi:MAG: hypothetical protein Q4B28_07580 [bacterium]|nr:hypothetical protein [bacterium]